MNHPHAALKCLERAYFITPQDQQVLLNMCASLSALDRHDSAFEFAKRALEIAVGKNKAICIYNMAV